jgi:hypothetical protein
MRKIASSLLLLVFLFNMIGYRAWFYYAEKQSDVVMESRLDNEQYSDNDLIALTVPLDNPYQLEQKNFQRVDGEISFGGKTFKYVKRKVSEGNLVLLCIPDTHKMLLKKAKTDYGNSINDLPGNTKNSSRNDQQKNISGGDYICQSTDMQLGKYAGSPLRYNKFHLVLFSDPEIATQGKPPQSIIA